MDQRNNNYRPKRTPTPSNPDNRTVRKNYPDDVDRYNYVDRDIYSNGGSHYADDSRYTGGGRRGKKRNNRKKGGAKKVFFTILSLVLIIALGVGAYAMIMMSRLDRSDNTNTASYVEQPSAAPTWGVISDSKVTNILLIGTDKGDDGNSSRSDTTMLLSIDNTAKTIKLVSFLRDLYVEIPTIKKQKLNAAYSKGGAGLTMSLQDPTKKMSKSDENVNGYVAVLDKPDDIMRKFKRAITDSEACVRSAEGKDGVNNLMGIYSCVTGLTNEQIEKEFEGKGYGDFKTAVGEAVVEHLRPIQERYADYSKNKDYLEKCYTDGAQKAFSISNRTLSKVMKKVGFIPKAF